LLEQYMLSGNGIAALSSSQQNSDVSNSQSAVAKENDLLVM